eukprot:c26250_g1_i11 orf=373-1089(+)
MQMHEEKKSPMCCVHCGTPVNEVYVQYSPGNIRLTKCILCKCVADEYVECEMMIIVIDLILHKPEAYRHLFFNYPNLNKLDLKDLIWKASMMFLILDSCKQSILGAGKVNSVKWESLSAFMFTAGMVLALVALRSVVYLSTIFMASCFAMRRSPYVNVRMADILLALLLSSYFKLFTFAMMIWDFSPIMIYMIDMFVLSSNALAFKVMLNTTTPTAVASIAAGTVVTFLVDSLIQFCR